MSSVFVIIYENMGSIYVWEIIYERDSEDYVETCKNIIIIIVYNNLYYYFYLYYYYYYNYRKRCQVGYYLAQFLSEQAVISGPISIRY